MEEAQAVSSTRVKLKRIEDASPVFLFLFLHVWGGARGAGCTLENTALGEREGRRREGERDRVAGCGLRGRERGRPPVGLGWWAGRGWAEAGPPFGGTPRSVRAQTGEGLGPKRVRFWPGGMCDWPVTPRPLRGRHQRRHQQADASNLTSRYRALARLVIPNGQGHMAMAAFPAGEY